MLVLLASAGHSWAQNWYDVYEREVKVIEDDSAGEAEWTRSVGRLGSALDRASGSRADIKQTGGEGRFFTYNRANVEPFHFQFYLGWGYIRTKNYDRAAEHLKRAQDVGFIKSDGRLNTKLGSLLALLDKLGPAQEFLNKARREGKICLDDTGTFPAGTALAKQLGELERTLETSTEPGSIEASRKALEGALGECATQITANRFAGLLPAVKAARERLTVPDLDKVLRGDTRANLSELISAAAAAESAGDPAKAQTALDGLNGIEGTVVKEVGDALRTARREAERWLPGNVATLNELDQLGVKLQEETGAANRLQKPAEHLTDSVRITLDLRDLSSRAASGFPRLLQAKKDALTAAQARLASWRQSNRCALEAKGATAEMAGAAEDATDALRGESADAMVAATQGVEAAIRKWEPSIGDALPTMQKRGKDALSLAEQVLPTIRNDAKKTTGTQYVEAVKQALDKGDLCDGPGKIQTLQAFMLEESGRLKLLVQQATARNEPTLNEARDFLSQLAVFLESEERTAIRTEADKLGELLGGFDPDAIDASGKALGALVQAGKSKVQAQVASRVEEFTALRAEPCWRKVSSSRRGWLERQRASISEAARTATNAPVLLRFYQDFSRAEVECRLNAAWTAFFEEQDVPKAAGLLESIDESTREKSSSLSFSLAFFYWWQAKSSPDGGEEMLERARSTYAKGTSLVPAGSGAAGGVLFSPDFIRDMAGSVSLPGGGQ